MQQKLKAEHVLRQHTPIGIVKIVSQKIKLMEHAKERVSEEGIVVRDQKGSVIPHPCLKIIKDTENELLQIYASYGKKII